MSTAAQVRGRFGILQSMQDAGRVVTMQSSPEEKVRLFWAMFCGREDVFAEEDLKDENEASLGDRLRS